VGGLPELDGDYTVFGEVVEGFDVIDKIGRLPTDKNDRPLTDVKITIEECD
jgi:cyclophilin family peptidyl-prolyl cis-trans isomerase